MTGNAEDSQADTLLRLALAEESALILPQPDHIFGFCAQQAYEKLIKALISKRGAEFPYVHRFQPLLDILSELEEELPRTDYNLMLMEPFGVQHRYDFGREIGEEEREHVRAALREISGYIQQRFAELNGLTAR